MKALAPTILAFGVFATLVDAGNSQPISIHARPINLHTEDDLVDRVGRLRYRGGLDLTSPDPRFGGLSGLAVTTDGSRLSSVTDKGDWLRFSPQVSASGRLIGIRDAQMGDLLDRNGKPILRKRDGDAESLSPIDGGLAVTFERRHRIWLYRGTPNPFLARPSELSLPLLSGGMSKNKGLEASARLRDGRLMVLAEGVSEKAPFAPGWVFGDGRWWSIRYRRHTPYHPTGAVTLPDGTVLVLERRFSFLGGFGTRLVAVSQKSIRPGGVMDGREVARLVHPLVTANFEGVTFHRNGAGETVLYLISDDNFAALQRTILLKFVLERNL